MTQEEIHDLLALGDEDAYIFPIEDFDKVLEATWVASETQKHSVTGSLQNPLPATNAAR